MMPVQQMMLFKVVGKPLPFYLSTGRNPERDPGGGGADGQTVLGYESCASSHLAWLRVKRMTACSPVASENTLHISTPAHAELEMFLTEAGPYFRPKPSHFVWDAA